MQRKYWTLLCFSLVAAAASVQAASCRTNGCNVDPDCDSNEPGTGGAGGSTPEYCVPKLEQDNNGTAVKDECGVFVRLAGNDENDGTKNKPFATFAKAMEKAREPGSTRRIYACAEIFAEPLEITTGIEIYGGLNCAAGLWSHSAKKTTIAPDADKVPIKFVKEEEGKIHVEDVIARAPDAVLAGGSSIAAIAGALTVELVRCDLEAGIASDGEPGQAPPGEILPTSADDPQIVGKPGTAACMGGSAGNLGGERVTNPFCLESKSGSGGTGKEMQGEAGGDGEPAPNPNPSNFGKGGTGATGSGCTNGQSGAAGTEGEPGKGANKETDLGSIDLSGYAGVDGTSGTKGNTGQGGGGGGASKGKTGCYGPSGGSGGAGGCGGGGGTGGKAGGSSIALISLGATLVFTEVTLSSKGGGNGGDGGEGQTGGTGGSAGKGGAPAGSGLLTACGGGNGGPGGTGGTGGGGHGGHSIGIAWRDLAPPELSMDSSISIGLAGNGGNGDPTDGIGANGVAENVFQIQ